MPISDHEFHKIGSRVDGVVARVLEVTRGQVGLSEGETTTQTHPGQGQVSMLRIPGHAVNPLGDRAVGIGGDEAVVWTGIANDVVLAAQCHRHRRVDGQHRRVVHRGDVQAHGRAGARRGCCTVVGGRDVEAGLRKFGDEGSVDVRRLDRVVVGEAQRISRQCGHQNRVGQLSRDQGRVRRSVPILQHTEAGRRQARDRQRPEVRRIIRVGDHQRNVGDDRRSRGAVVLRDRQGSARDADRRVDVHDGDIDVGPLVGAGVLARGADLASGTITHAEVKAVGGIGRDFRDLRGVLDAGRVSMGEHGPHGQRGS